jgi:hypothetical protein
LVQAWALASAQVWAPGSVLEWEQAWVLASVLEWEPELAPGLEQALVRELGPALVLV